MQTTNRKTERKPLICTRKYTHRKRGERKREKARERNIYRKTQTNI